MNTNTTGRLNDYLHSFIQTNGMDYVVMNFIALRNDYYAMIISA